MTENTNEQINWEAVLGKLEQVRNLQERAATQGEAEAAAAALTRLLTKYNLSMEEFDARTSGKPEKTAYGRDVIDLGNQAQWRRSLVNAIARVNFCRAVWSVKTTTITIIGKPHNVQMVQSLFPILLLEVERLTEIGWRAARSTDAVEWWHSAAGWKKSFRLGVVRGIRDAMQEARQAEIASAPTGNALVLVIDEELAQAERSFFPNATSSKEPAYFAGAFNAGRIVGRTVNVTGKQAVA